MRKRVVTLYKHLLILTYIYLPLFSRSNRVNEIFSSYINVKRSIFLKFQVMSNAMCFCEKRKSIIVEVLCDKLTT